MHAVLCKLNFSLLRRSSLSSAYKSHVATLTKYHNIDLFSHVLII